MEVLKILVVGGPKTGKTSLVSAFLGEELRPSVKSSLISIS